jgi:DNA-binding transcriptional regulator LsrR (DeoR family)
VAVTSCGSVKETGPFPRWARLMSEASAGQDYQTFFRMLESRGVVGDLLYHFLDADGGWHRKIPGAARDIEEADLKKLATHTEGDPQIYSVSPPGMARIARRGVCMLLVHSADRAALARAALLRKKERPVNFIITTRAAAEEILGSGAKRRA